MITSFFNKNSLVLTLNGYKKINEITTQDIVSTQDGCWKKVLEVKSIKEKSRTIVLQFGLKITASLDSYIFNKNTIGADMSRISFKDITSDSYLAYPKQSSFVNNSFKNILAKDLSEQDSFLKDYFSLLEYNTKVSIPFEYLSNSLSIQKLLINNYNNLSPIHCIMKSFIFEYNLGGVSLFSYNSLWLNNIETIIDNEEEELFGLKVDGDDSFTVFNIAVGNSNE